MPQSAIKLPDAKQELLDTVGETKPFQIFNNQVLVAIYIRPEKTAGGIYITQNVRDEDKWQGKVGLVIGLGPMAFDDDSGVWFKDIDVGLHDWVVFQPSEGWGMLVNGTMCRLLNDTAIRGKIDNPDRVW